VECEGEQALPADSLVVVNLPKVHAAPRDWLNFLAALQQLLLRQQRLRST
jgi:hypothetical protein